MRNLWTTPSMSEFSKLSNQDPNFQLLFCWDNIHKSLQNFIHKNPVYYKKFIHKNLKLKSLLYGCQSFQSRDHLSFFSFHSHLLVCFPYSLSFSLPHYNTKLHIAVIVIFLCLGLNRFFFSFFFNYFQFYLLERPLLLKLMLSPL